MNDLQLDLNQKEFIFIKDIKSLVNWDLIEEQYNKLTFQNNTKNLIGNNFYFLSHKDLSSFKFDLETLCANFLIDNYGIEDKFENLYITNSWVNKTEPGQSHHHHVHHFSVISGVIFLDNHISNLNLTFEIKMAEIPHLLCNNYTIFLSLKEMLAGKNIDPSSVNNLQHHVVLFLSNTQHFVKKTELDAPPRRTISFNTFWKGCVGIQDNPFASYKF